MAKLGRPFGTTKPKTVCYHRRIRPEWVEVLDKVLNELKQNAIIESKGVLNG
jgi:hypothetical protein